MQIENTLYVYFNKKYGENTEKRFMKLESECGELFEAFDKYRTATDPEDRSKKLEHLMDELGDVAAILSHINSLLGTDFEELLINALVKSKVREVHKNYMR